jgi:CubicO group peptidase (beta-lactamase class C family)
VPDIVTIANPELAIVAENKQRWNHPTYRRHGFHNLHKIGRYGLTFRSARVMTLDNDWDLRIAEMDEVKRLVGVPWFSGMVVIRGQDVLYEKYAPDFPQDQPHSIQSIGKMTMNLIVGPLVDKGLIDLAKPVSHYLPEVGSGYATATVQQVLNMDVANDYTEDFDDINSTYFQHEEAMGFRLPRDPAREETMRGYIAKITSKDTTNRSGHTQYKDSNTEIAGWIAERVSGRPLRAYLADIVDAAGLEGTYYTTTDREGVPVIAGGATLTARDLARFGALFVRRGKGADGSQVGSASFIEKTLTGGVTIAPPRSWLRYHNQCNTSGRWLGHGGYGGQYMLCDLTSGVVAAYYSVMEDRSGYVQPFFPPLIRMLESVAALEKA